MKDSTGSFSSIKFYFLGLLVSRLQMGRRKLSVCKLKIEQKIVLKRSKRYEIKKSIKILNPCHTVNVQKLYFSKEKSNINNELLSEG